MAKGTGESVTHSREIEGLKRLAIAVEKTTPSTHYAAHWLTCLGADLSSGADTAKILICAGADESSSTPRPARCQIRLWDFQVGQSGTGGLASAASGASTVIGFKGGTSGGLPGEIPEKWCGLYAAILALAECWAPDGPQVVYDVSSADILRAFALQNSGTPDERQATWRRNGRIPVNHGGIFPMGFYPCKDGYVALLGRSRRDWLSIRAALGDPEWAKDEAFSNPFIIARDSETADKLLTETLSAFTRDELLSLGLEHGAVVAPVLDEAEGFARGVFREGFAAPHGPAMPFLVTPPDETSGGKPDSALDVNRPERGPGPTRSRVRPAPVARRADSTARPLAGLRCIELCWVWSGPMVGQTLADLGAEVIKVESQTRFDLYRTRGLEAQRGKMHEATRLESSLYFHSLNRNKVGITIDLKSDAGLATMKELIAASDVLLDNFTAGTLDRLGLTTQIMHELNPGLTVVSMSGPGKGSPLQALRSYGLVLSALGGVEANITSGGEFVGSPTYSISDPNAALFATLAALGGAVAVSTAMRAQEGAAMGAAPRGSAIDVSQIEASGTLGATRAVTAQGYAAVFSAEGSELALSGERETVEALAVSVSGLPKGQLIERCRAAAVGVTPVLELTDTDDSEVFSQCSGWLDAVHPETGAERLVAQPWRVNGQRPGLYKAAPRLGEGNRYVLGHVLGHSDEAIDSLLGDGATPGEIG